MVSKASQRSRSPMTPAVEHSIRVSPVSISIIIMGGWSVGRVNPFARTATLAIAAVLAPAVSRHFFPLGMFADEEGRRSQIEHVNDSSNGCCEHGYFRAQQAGLGG